MSNGQTPAPASPMEDAGGVSGMMNLTINLPDNIRISTVDGDEEENEVASANVTGSIIAFAGRTAPAGWLLCNGAAISRATYADLFAVIGTDYGVGNANTTFNLPDFRGRFMLGLDNMGAVSADRVTAAEADELGGAGGAETHTLSNAELASHSHAMLIYSNSSAGDNLGESQENPSFKYLGISNSGAGKPYARYSYRRGVFHEYDVTDRPYLAYPSGDNAPHDNMPPYQTVNYIIKT